MVNLNCITFIKKIYIKLNLCYYFIKEMMEYKGEDVFSFKQNIQKIKKKKNSNCKKQNRPIESKIKN